MYSILLAVKKPDVIDHEGLREYDNILSIWEGIAKRDKGTKLLAQNLFLLPLDKELLGVADAVHSFRRLPYAYTLLPEEQRWHEGRNVVVT
uniref:Uncharacterized protein n=1 Tax=viral metagenome TaxID=1070528 RepID=A0A6M3KXR2_9ZZZZ